MGGGGGLSGLFAPRIIFCVIFLFYWSVGTKIVTGFVYIFGLPPKTKVLSSTQQCCNFFTNSFTNTSTLIYKFFTGLVHFFRVIEAFMTGLF